MESKQSNVSNMLHVKETDIFYHIEGKTYFHIKSPTGLQVIHLCFHLTAAFCLHTLHYSDSAGRQSGFPRVTAENKKFVVAGGDNCHQSG